MATILIVDDNPDTCKPLALLLNRIGHKSLCLFSGEEALAFLRRERPDLVILDVMMPGMDGIEVLRNLRADPTTANLPVVMFSAVADEAFRQHAIQKGANDYWVKASFDFSELSRRIATHLPSA